MPETINVHAANIQPPGCHNCEIITGAIAVIIAPVIPALSLLLWIESVCTETVDEILSINLISELISSILSFTSSLNLFRLVVICSFK